MKFISISGKWKSYKHSLIIYWTTLLLIHINEYLHVLTEKSAYYFLVLHSCYVEQRWWQCIVLDLKDLLEFVLTPKKYSYMFECKSPFSNWKQLVMTRQYIIVQKIRFLRRLNWKRSVLFTHWVSQFASLNKQSRNV